MEGDGFGSLPKNDRIDHFASFSGHTEKQVDYLPEENRKVILLIGNSRAGKTSVANVIYQKTTPDETYSLRSTTEIVKHEPICKSVILDFDLYELPASCVTERAEDDALDTDLLHNLLSRCAAIIFLIDAQEVEESNNMELARCFQRAHALTKEIQFNRASKKPINIEVFLHKVDGLADEAKMIFTRSIKKAFGAVMAERGDEITFRTSLTSIYDHSIFEAFSKVIQRLFDGVNMLETLLEMYIKNSNVEKAFLFDIYSKIYIATDEATVDPLSYELCCDMIDVVLSSGQIYCGNDSFDDSAVGIIKLKNLTSLYMREICENVALICIMRQDSLDKQGIIDYNFRVLRNGVRQVFRISPCSSKSSSLERTDARTQPMKLQPIIEGPTVAHSLSPRSERSSSSRACESPNGQKSRVNGNP